MLSRTWSVSSINAVQDDEKLAVFFSVIWVQVYAVPAVARDKSFEEVKLLLGNHYSSKS